MKYIYTKKDALIIEKHGVKMLIYNSKEDCAHAAVAYQETKHGHAEEFSHEKSAFIYYIIDGQGKWIIEDTQYDVGKGDVVIVPPGKRFYFKGNVKQICVTAPAWEERYERHVRYVEGLK